MHEHAHIWQEGRGLGRGFAWRMCLAAVLCLLLSCEVQAQLQAEQSSRDEIEYTIPAMDLGQALHTFARQSGLQILFSPAVVANKTSPKIVGELPPSEALKRLLDETGLEHVFTGPEFVIIRQSIFEQEKTIGTTGGLRTRLREAHSSNSVTEGTSGAGPEQGQAEKRELPSTYTLEGYVTRGRSDTKLVGALVSIPKLGLSQATGRHGFFRIKSVPAGRYILEVGYFGQGTETFPIDLETGADDPLFLAYGQDPEDEIIVSGVQSAHNNSINMNRASGHIVSILAADLDGRFPDDTIAEALRRAPGVAFERDERGGEGQYITIRGLSAEYNKVTVNGVDSPLGGIWADRRVPLDGYLADSVSRVTVHKTLLPEHPTEGIGGVMDIQTISDAPSQDRTIALTGEARYSDFNDKTGFLFNGQYSDSFGGSDQFHLQASATFRRRLLRTYQFDVLGDVYPDTLPLAQDGTPISDIEALGLTQLDESDLSRVEDMRLNIFDDQRDVLSIVTSGGWEVSDNMRVRLSSTYNAQDIKDRRSSISFEQSDRFTDVDADGTLIDPLTGQFHFYGRSPFVRARMEVEDESSVNHIVSANVETWTNGFELDYGVGYSSGKSSIPLSTEIDFETDDLDELAILALNPVAPTGYSYIDFDQSNGPVPVPSFTEAGYAYLANPENFSFRDLRIRSSEGRNKIFSAHLDALWKSDSEYLDYIKAGLLFTHSDRRVENITLFDDDTVFADGSFGGDGSFRLSDTDLISDGFISLAPIDNIIPGFQGVFQTDRDSVRAFREQLLASTDFSPDGETGLVFRDSTEKALAGYVSAKLDMSPALSVTGGVRAELYRGDFRATQIVDIVEADDTTTVNIHPTESAKRHTTELLPRVLLTYRPSDRWTFKGGLFESIARPRFALLNAPDYLYIDQDAQEAFIYASDPQRGNIKARNYDLGGQFFGMEGRYFDANLYYKSISNFTIPDFGVIGGGLIPIDSSELTERLLGTGLMTLEALNKIESVQGEGPFEGTSAEAYGIDLSYLQQFDARPGYWDELGLRLTASVQKTRFVLDSENITSRVSPFVNAPAFSGTASAWYTFDAFSAYAIYSYQGRQLNSAEALFPDEYIQPYSALDLRLEYDLPLGLNGQYTAYVAASDVLDGGLKATTYETIGTGTALLDDIEYNGRELRFGITGKF